MTVFYFSHFDLLWPGTNQISDIRFCEGFAENGCDVEMIVPYVNRPYNIKESEIFGTYGIQHPFKITILPTPFRMGLSKWVTVPVLTTLLIATYLRILSTNWRQREKVFILSRDANSLLPMLLTNRLILKRGTPRVIYWAHEVKLERWQYRWVYQNVDAIIGTNSAILEDIHKAFGVPRERMKVTLNPVSTWQVEYKAKKWELRAKLELGQKRPLIVYTGKLEPGMREIEYILDAAAKLSTYTFLITGGMPDIVKLYKGFCKEREMDNVMFTGFINNYTDVIQYQAAADVLISFYSRQDHLVDYNYPQKITEYMLTRNPIVTPDYRATRDVLNRNNAIFVDSENVDSLVDGIRRAVERTNGAAHVAARAFQDVQGYTFKKRTRLLMEFFRSLP